MYQANLGHLYINTVRYYPVNTCKIVIAPFSIGKSQNVDITINCKRYPLRFKTGAIFSPKICAFVVAIVILF